MHATLLLSTLLLGQTTTGENWPGFRGDGTSRSSSRDLPMRWSPKENIAWRAALPGYGQSSPVVWGAHVYLTAIEGKEKEKCIVVAADFATGKTIWQREFRASQKGKNNPMMSRAAPTPVAGTDGLWVFFEGGDLIHLSHQGELRWQRSLVQEYGEFKNNHGLGSSLAQNEMQVFVLVEHAGPSYLLAVDKSTGKTAWKTDRQEARGCWTTPVFATIGAVPLVLVSGSGTLSGYDARTGKEVFTETGFVGNNIPSPTVVGDRIIVAAGENRFQPDRTASIRSNCCLEVEIKNDKAASKIVWRATKALSHQASPLVHRGMVYFLTQAGVVYCHDLATGAERFAERLDGPCWASPIAVEDRVYFFGKDGTTTVLRSGAKFDTFATNTLWSRADFDARFAAAKKSLGDDFGKRPTGKAEFKNGKPSAELEATRYSAVGDVVYGAAAARGSIFLRTGDTLICIRARK